MRRSTVGRTALATLASGALLTLAGCGDTRVDGGTTGPAATPSAPGTSAPASSPRPTRRVSTELRRLEDTACGTTTPQPTAEESSSPPATEAMEDRPPNYADNHAYRRTLPIEGLAGCRGEAHVARLTANLGTAPVDRARVDTELSRLGYGDAVERIQSVDDTVRFAIGLDGVCVTGTLTPAHRNTIEAHGPYLEGGCVEPVPGH
ncbi:hypothetical protein AB0H86_11800 [Streptomyces sp. NPDC050997]|uniref:hypothetical protein n=1 Tax=Streptomyces sp. NPDC050997 TaxID=3155519 RepID=UPI00343469F4